MKSRHILLSRKYRPKNFCELEGQEVLVKTLSNAISLNKLAQSYLLTGIRGVGKTTTARIIAKTINCTDLKIIDNLPIPCEECNNCNNINNGSHPDILEIDAASRTGVDDVRIIIENAEYKPMMGNYKVFIVDEVHMLSKSAFNALLKLLEEPPAHCLFIFATTEVHKIPLTIISRCQRFDLSRFSNEDLEKFLQKISAKENLNISSDAIKIIASKADGSARDSLSLLDQAILLSQENNSYISREIVEKMVSAVDHRIIYEFLSSIVNSDPKLAINMLGEFYKANTNFDVFISEFLSVLSYLAKKLAINNYESDEFHSIKSELEVLLQKIDMSFVQIAWQISYKTEMDLKSSYNCLESMEMLALKLIYLLSQKNSEPLPRQRSETAIITPLKQHNNLSFQSFLKYLSDNREFHLLFDLLNKTQLESKGEEYFAFATQKINQKFESELKSKLSEWSGAKIEAIFSYKDTIIPYKEMIKNKLINEDSFQKILKNFSAVEIVDILVSTNTKN